MTDSRKTDGSSVDDMDLLQDLILGEEKSRLHKLDHRVSDLESRTADIAEVLPAAMSRVAGDPVKRPDFERPVVSTIRSAIKRDADSFAEALFPVLGPAIRRAVADALRSMVQRINVALENSFTIKGLRWRIEAARTGVPFAQIVLRHTMLYAVQEAFLIQRGSGLVLSSVHMDESLALDEDAVSSMLTAIQSFIQDSFGGSPDEPLRSAELGDRTMWVINGPVAVLACVITGTPPRPVRDELMDLLETMHARFGKEFHGNPEQLAGNEGLHSLMNEALREEADETVSSSNRLKYTLVWGIFTLLVLAYLIFSGVNAYRDQQFMKKVDSLFKSQAGYVVTESSMQDHVLTLDGLKDPLAVSLESLMTENAIPEEKLIVNFRPYQSLETEIVSARIRGQLDIDPSTSLTISGNNLEVNGMVTGLQLAGLQTLSQTHVLIDNLNLDGLRLNANEASPMIRQALQAPDSVIFTPAGARMEVSGLSTAAWMESAQNAAIYSAGWQLDFSPLRQNLSDQMDVLVDQLNGSEFLFINGIRLTSDSQDALEDVALGLVELQALASLTGRELVITLEGLADGIDTFEKNQEVARKRSERVLTELESYGVNPEGIEHVFGQWKEGGINPNMRRATILIEASARQ